MADNTNGGKAEDDGARTRIIIKKYANRRLYNTARSSYVTLSDLAGMVRAGEDFMVCDAKTHEDITRSVLTQIIVEEEAGENNLLPTGFLRELIRMYGDPMQGMVPGYLDATMEAFRQNQAQLSRALGGNLAMENFEQLARSNIELFQRSMQMFTPGGQRQAGSSSGGPARANPERPQPTQETARPGEKARERGSDLDALQKQLREMQTQLERLSREKK